MESVVFAGHDKNHIVVIGDGIDSVDLTVLLRKKVGSSELVSVDQVEYGGGDDGYSSYQNPYGYGPGHGYEVSNQNPYAYGVGYGYGTRNPNPYAYGSVHGYETRNPYADGRGRRYESRNESSDGCCSIM